MISFKKIGLSLAVVASLSFCGCGSSSSDNTTLPTGGGDEITTKNYNGAGSRWELNFKSDGNATITEANSNLEINATYEDMESGFRKISVTNSSDTSKANIGDITYGFELPDYMFPFVSFTDNKLLPTVINDGECPTAQNHNFVVSFADSGSATNDFDGWGAYGYWEYKSDENKTYVDVFKRDGTQTTDINFNGSIISNCSGGKLYGVENGETTTGYFSKTGGIIWQQMRDSSNANPGGENDFMIPKETNLNSINQINGEYIGYSISGNGQTSYTNTPVNVVATDGALVVKELDITNNTIGNKLSDISLTTEVSGTKGLWKGQVTTTSPSGTDGIGCAVDLDAGGSGKNVVICGAMLPDGTNKNLYSLILVSK
jgi:hypothetical protein